MGAMNLISYLRVSTDQQAEHGFGLQVQDEQITSWARAAGHRIVASYRDEGISGSTDVDGRPGLASALAATATAEGLVVAKLDRLARKLTVQEAVLAQVWRSGGRVFTVDLGEVLQDDPDDPMRTAMRQMVGVFAQLERAMIVARMTAGRRAKRERGGFASFGSPSFGQRAEGKELVRDGAEQVVIARMVELRDEGQSLRAISATLNLEGLRPKRAEQWYPETVRRVLRRLETPTAEAA